jgi:hypothetical protein
MGPIATYQSAFKAIKTRAFDTATLQLPCAEGTRPGACPAHACHAAKHGHFPGPQLAVRDAQSRYRARWSSECDTCELPQSPPRRPRLVTHALWLQFMTRRAKRPKHFPKSAGTARR